LSQSSGATGATQSYILSHKMSINLECFLSVCLYDTHLDWADGVAVGPCSMAQKQRRKEKGISFSLAHRFMQIAHVDHLSDKHAHKCTPSLALALDLALLCVWLSLFSQSLQSGRIGRKYTFVRRSNRTELNVGKHLLPHADIMCDICKHFE
jgi:hypothetical protein